MGSEPPCIGVARMAVCLAIALSAALVSAPAMAGDASWPEVSTAFSAADEGACHAADQRMAQTADELEALLLRLHVARCLFAVGATADAARRMVELGDSRAEDLELVADHLPWVAELHARAMLHHGRIQEALEAHEELYRRVGDRTQTRERRARVLYHLGLAQEAAGRDLDARATYRRLRDEYPGSRHAALVAPLLLGDQEDQGLWFRRAERALEDRHYAAAEALFHRVACAGEAACDPREAAEAGGLRYEAAWRIGHLLYRYRREYVARGEPWLRAVIAAGGEREVVAAHTLGLALMRMQRSDDAIAHWRAFERSWPRDSRAHEARYFQGWMHFTEGRFPEAIRALEGYLERYPRGARRIRAQWWIGWAWYRMDRCEEAQRAWGAVRGAERDRPTEQFAYWKAVCDARLGREAEARQAWESLRARDPWSWYGLLSARRLEEPLLPEAGARPPLPARPTPSDLAAVLAWAGMQDEAELVEGIRPQDGTDAERAMQVTSQRRDWLGWRRGAASRSPRGPVDASSLQAWRQRYPPFHPGPVARAATEWGVPEHVIRGVIQQESAWDRHALSPSDAMGLMQVIPQTAQAIAADRDLHYEDGMLFESRHAIDFGSWYLGALVRKFDGQLIPAIAAYNAGPIAVEGWLDRAAPARPLDEFVEEIAFDQARTYVRRVVSASLRYALADSPLEDFHDDTLGGLLPREVRAIYGAHPGY